MPTACTSWSALSFVTHSAIRSDLNTRHEENCERTLQTTRAGTPAPQPALGRLGVTLPT